MPTVVACVVDLCLFVYCTGATDDAEGKPPVSFKPTDVEDSFDRYALPKAVIGRIVL
jgi:hypothetical protein